MAATLADVAKRVGCSTATVSRVLTGSGKISSETRQAVIEAAQSLGYQPRINRRSASLEADAHHGGTIDVIVHRRSPYERLTLSGEQLKAGELSPYTREDFMDEGNRLSNSFERGILDGLIDEASVWGYRVAVRATADLADEGLLSSLTRERTSGVILMGEYPDELGRFVAAVRRPLILLDLIMAGGPPVVTIDNAKGIAAAFDHLFELGHRDIAFLAGPSRVVAFEERRLAFLAKAAETGIVVNRSWVYHGSPHMVDAGAWVEKLLGRGKRPTALMCSNDFLAIGAIQAATRRGIEVPKKLSVVGFDDIEPAALVTPALTSVRVPTLEMGRQAVRQMMLAVRASRESRGVTVRVTPELVVRESSVPPKR